MLRRFLATSLVLAALVTCLPGRAAADDDDIVNSMGFEFPFTTFFGGTGQLEGQVNPAGEGQVIPPGQWLRMPSPQRSGGTFARVQSAVVAPGGGIQAVRVDRVADDEAHWAVPVDGLGYPDYPSPFPPEPAQPLISIRWEMRVEPTGRGTFFGVQAFDGVGMLAALGVDNATGAVVYRAPGTGTLTPTGVSVSFGEWDIFQITLDYSTDQYTIFHNMTELGLFGFVDAGLDQFSRAGIAALAAGDNTGLQGVIGTAYFDNFLIREGPLSNTVPEPGSGIMLALALAVAAYVRGRWLE